MLVRRRVSQLALRLQLDVPPWREGNAGLTGARVTRKAAERHSTCPIEATDLAAWRARPSNAPASPSSIPLPPVGTGMRGAKSLENEMANTEHLAPLVAKTADRPRIYVACLAAYNAGRLHGAWIDITEPDDIRDRVSAMLKESPDAGAEEWAIHDYEGFAGAYLSEWESFETICTLADFISEHGALGAKLYTHFGNDLDQARAQLDDYAGQYESLGYFAEQLHDDIGTDIPDALKFYIDWDALGQDMELSGDIVSFELRPGEIHIFWAQ